MIEAAGISWLNGSFLPASDVCISPQDRGFLIGDGVFDTMAVCDREPIDMDAHFQRLFHDAHVLGIAVPYGLLALIGAARQLVLENALSGDGALRTTVTRGVGGRGLSFPDQCNPMVLMTLTEIDRAVMSAPVSLIIARNVMCNERSPLSRIKSLNYGDNILARKEAAERGVDDALMLNTKGHVVSSTVANVFIREDDALITPPVEDGVLPGVMRSKLVVQENTKEESIAPERLLKADAVFLTNSLTGMRHVRMVEDVVFDLNGEQTP